MYAGLFSMSIFDCMSEYYGITDCCDQKVETELAVQVFS
jgi:hypothetical protein